MRRRNAFNKSPAVEITKTLQKFNFSQLHLIFENSQRPHIFFKIFKILQHLQKLKGMGVGV